MLDDGVGRVEDGLGGAVILLELDDFDLGEMLFHVEQVGDFRAAPAVNALVIVADDAQVAMLLRQRLHQLELRGVGVLVFIHHHVAVLRAAGASASGCSLEKPQREQDQVVEIHGIAGAQGGLVTRADVFGQGPRRLGRRKPPRFAAISETAQQAPEPPPDRSFRPSPKYGSDIFLTAPSCSDSS